MRKLVKLHPRDVGLAFLSNLAAAQTEPSKPKRRVQFRRLIKALSTLNLLPADFVWEFLTLGVDKNGEGIVLVEGTNRNPRPIAKKTN